MNFVENFEYSILMYYFLSFCFIVLFIGIVVYRRWLDNAHKQIDDLSTCMNQQSLKYSEEKALFDFEMQLSEIRSKYSKPHLKWAEYIMLKKDLSPLLKEWIDALEKLNLSESENKFCIYSLLYPHVSLHDLANYMHYSYDGLRVLKSRLLKKINVSACDFENFLKKDLLERDQ